MLSSSGLCLSSPPALGDVEVVHAEAVGLQVVLEFFDGLLAVGALVVVAPEFGSVALAVGDEDPEGVAIQVDVGDATRFEKGEQGVFEKTGIGPHGA